ncbi:hypothetical protein NQ318_019576 [Aromia moschata]|uniref:Uncharacterized protein n=1 Tax=Aromia moschata TaxID=1265417 RepID=A0AAV8Z5M2_9CUCU|nr:hypothetical protein NQ318_019576 [Aromia moschata]
MKMELKPGQEIELCHMFLGGGEPKGRQEERPCVGEEQVRGQRQATEKIEQAPREDVEEVIKVPGRKREGTQGKGEGEEALLRHYIHADNSYNIYIYLCIAVQLIYIGDKHVKGCDL